MAATKRRPLVAGNWKMHLLRSEAEAFCAAFVSGLPPDLRAELALFPSFPLLAPVGRALAGSGIGLGGQDLHWKEDGAHTGDVSGHQLVDSGCEWVLCGHSERRRDHAESDATVLAKARAALDAGLRPVVCVGESGEERSAGRTFDVLARQIAELPADSRLVLAYEPVWAIGSGETASPETAEEAHCFLRGRVAGRRGEAAAETIRILYGGSVTPENAAELAARPDVDGFLVGGASLDPGRFLAILHVFDPSGSTSRGTP